MKWLRLAVVATAVALGLPAGVSAQNGDDRVVYAPILTLDSAEVFRETAYGRRIQAELDRAFRELATENQEITAALEAEERELTDLRATTEAEDFRALAEAFDAKVVRLRTEQDRKEDLLRQQSRQAEQGFIKAIEPILEEIAASRRAVAIVRPEALILSAGVIDVTDEAIRRIDQRLGDGLNVPPPGEEPAGQAPDDASTVDPTEPDPPEPDPPEPEQPAIDQSDPDRSEQP